MFRSSRHLFPLFLAGCSLYGGGLTAYELPSAVLRTFRAQHPLASDVTYRQENRKGVRYYRIEFTESDAAREAEYTAEGKLLAVDEPSARTEPDAAAKEKE